MNKILIITCSEERNVKRVTKFLNETEVPFFRFNTDQLLNQYTIQFGIGNKDLNWKISDGSKTIISDNISSIWYRRPTPPKADKFPANFKGFMEDEMKKTLRSMWHSLRHKVLWVNHPHDLRFTELDKPTQMKIAAEKGLKIPETLITNNPEEAIKFANKHGDIAIKTMGSTQAYINKDKIYHDYTRRISVDEVKKHKNNITLVPVMFQEYIPKDIELRITIVGSKIFSCSIHTQDSERTKEDWRRYDFKNVKHEEFKLPNKIKSKLLDFMRYFNLQFGTIDMILTPDGEYIFLEINPSGQWGWIEALTGMPIDKNIADLLVNPKLSLK